MITVKVYSDNKRITGIEVSGHSGYEEVGKDIVCSSVSTAMILSINLLEKLNADIKYVSDEKIPLISLDILSFDDSIEQIVQTILVNLIENLNEVSKNYKKYLKIYEIRR